MSTKIGVNVNKVVTEYIKNTVKMLDGKRHERWNRGECLVSETAKKPLDFIRDGCVMYKCLNDIYKYLSLPMDKEYFDTDKLWRGYTDYYREYKQAVITGLKPTENGNLIVLEADFVKAYINEKYLKGYYDNYMDATYYIKSAKEPVYIKGDCTMDCMVLPVYIRE